MRTETWYGHEIHFVEINSEWHAILKDICDALKLRTAKIAERLDPNTLERVLVERNSRSFEGTLNTHKPVKANNRDLEKVWFRVEKNNGLFIKMEVNND